MEPEIRSYHLTISGENVKAGFGIQNSEFRSQNSEFKSRVGLDGACVSKEYLGNLFQQGLHICGGTVAQILDEN